MSGDEETQEQTIADDLVVTKFKMGADIANRKRGCSAASSPVTASLAPGPCAGGGGGGGLGTLGQARPLRGAPRTATGCLYPPAPAGSC